MKKKSIQKRLLAALLAGIMCIGSAQVFSGVSGNVQASEGAVENGKGYKNTTLFYSDFNDVENSELISKEGWTAHSDRSYGGKAEKNEVRVVSSAGGSATPVLNLCSESSGAGPRIIKHINVSALDNVVVEFDMRISDNGAANGQTGNNLVRAEASPTFYVGTVEDDNTSSRYLAPDPTNNNMVEMEQTYWSTDDVKSNSWRSAKLMFTILDNDTAEVTAYEKDGDTWEQSGETKEVTLYDGVLNLAFACRSYTGNDYNEGFLDNVYVYTQEVENKKTVYVSEKEEAVFSSDFNLAYNQLLSQNKGNWTAHSDWNTAESYGGGATANFVRITGAQELSLAADPSKNDTSGAGARIIKHIDTTAYSKMTVEFSVALQYEKEAGDYFGLGANDGPNFYVGVLEDDNVSLQNFTVDNKESGKAYMEQVFWKYEFDRTDLSNHDKRWKDVKLEFEILSENTATMTAYVKDGDEYVVDDEFSNKKVQLDEGLLRLAFGCQAYACHTNDDWYARAVLDDVDINATTKQSAITYVNEQLFEADFETTTANNIGSSLKKEGWSKGSYMFDNDGDGTYDIVPNQYDENALGALNSRLYIENEGNGNRYLALKSVVDGASTSRIQKTIDASNIDTFAVEFDFKNNVPEGTDHSSDYNRMKLFVSTEEDMTTQHLAPSDPVSWKGVSDGEWTRMKVIFDVNNEISNAYSWNEQTQSWDMVEDYQATPFTMDEDKQIHLTFSIRTRKNEAGGYLDNVNIYAIRKSVDGCFVDAQGVESYLEPITLDGASVRMVATNTEASGIRFIGRVNKEYISGLRYAYGKENVKFGVLVAPNDYVNGDFTIDALGAGKYLKIEGKIVANEDTAREDGYYEFRCAMINLHEGNYGRDFAFRSYIEIVDGDNQSTYVYSDFDKKDNVRSMATIATMALSDLSETKADEYQTAVKYDKKNTMYSPYTTAQRTFLENYCNYSIPLSSGSDIRVMSMNILDEDANDYAYSISDRAALLSKTILGYAPDVAGLQEVTKDWLNAISSDGQLTDYEVIQGTYKGGWFNWQTKTNETAILYNKNKVDVVEGKYGDYTNNYGYITLEGDDKGHTTTWAAMQTKAGEKLLFINAHPSYYEDNSNGVLAEQWGQIAQFITTLKSTYTGFAVIVVGDFNTSYGMDEYKLAAEAGLLDGQDAVLAGDCAGGFTCDTWHTYGLNAGDRFEAHGDYALDHVFVDKNTPASFKYFSVIINYPTQRMSDHYPIYADIQLN